ncbi:hypothetical protein GGP66_000225 [Salinibacter ruber]|uniref:sulfotransferase family protein n=1 Tax=Salinibacter ruber TaxID=146919 RepID=UPI00216918E7|nr:sulfotransferase [Salinibacter ruber]MCS3672821.1 hypothetical protein [Salinibacter ruber]
MIDIIKIPARWFDRRVTKGRLFLWWHGCFGQKRRSIEEMSNRAILIGGCGRSGTTLVLSLLSAHPNIFCLPREMRAFCANAYADENITKDPEFRIDYVYSHLIDTNFSSTDAKRWCEKTPKNVYFAEQLMSYFGEDARFIHVVRDGRDVVTSEHPAAPGEYWVSPKRWVEDVSRGREASSHPQVKTIRYEDVVSSPLEVMESTCAFLDEQFTEAAFRAYPESSQFDDRGEWFGGTKEMHGRSVARWKNEEYQDVVSRLMNQSGAEELLEYYGYL